MSDNPFGRVITAMVTPMHDDGSIDFDGLQRLAVHLADHGHDGLLVNGTTGESATTSDEEDYDCVAAVVEAVGDRVSVMAGCGTNDTLHSIRAAEAMVARGADTLLVVTPYYNKPTQPGLVAHFSAVADATDLPVLLYDIPGRAGIPIQTETLIRLAEHPRIVAVKDAKLDLEFSSAVMAETGLAFYCGTDAMTLPLLAVGGVGAVGTSTHVSGVGAKAMIEAYERGDTAEALRLHRLLLPIFTGIFRAQGVVLVKAALTLLGRQVGSVRPPLLDADDHEVSHLRQDLHASGLLPPDQIALLSAH